MTPRGVLKTETLKTKMMTKNLHANVHPHGETLSAYIDGMLDVAKTRGVSRHLRACASCRLRAEQLSETKSLLRAMPVPSRPDPDFWAGAYRRLRVDDREQALSRRTLWDFLRGPGHAPQRRWAAGLAAAAALGAVVAGPLTLHPSDGLPSGRPLMTAPQDVTPDVSALVESHTDSVSRLPLADQDRQKMIAADAQPGTDAPEATANADVPF